MMSFATYSKFMFLVLLVLAAALTGCRGPEFARAPIPREDVGLDQLVQRFEGIVFTTSITT
jgi:hypothetical protein